MERPLLILQKRLLKSQDTATLFTFLLFFGFGGEEQIEGTDGVKKSKHCKQWWIVETTYAIISDIYNGNSKQYNSSKKLHRTQIEVEHDEEMILAFQSIYKQWSKNWA